MTGAAQTVSRTAQFMALFRALESRRDGLFRDPLAREFLDRPLRLVTQAGRVPFLRAGLEGLIDHRWPGARTSGIARTRLIDDWVRDALSAGAEQLVILGSGFDTRAQRMRELARAKVFEVDRDAVLARKLETLRARGAAERAVYIPLDFDGEALPKALLQAGFEESQRSCFVWEGVTNYLTAEGVCTTLEGVAAVAAPGSRLIFTYVHRGVIDGSADFDASETALTVVNRAGEPWTFGLAPDEVAGFLEPHGFRLLEDLGAREYRLRHLPDKPRYLRGYEFYRAALAEVSH